VCQKKNRTFAFFSKITYKGYFHAKNRLRASKNLENASQTMKKSNFNHLL
jgi:hypothetical protein